MLRLALRLRSRHDSSHLELLEELARRAGDVNAAGYAALTVLHTLDDTGGLGALGAVCALVGVHHLLSGAGLVNLRHSAHISFYESGGSRSPGNGTGAPLSGTQPEQP